MTSIPKYLGTYLEEQGLSPTEQYHYRTETIKHWYNNII